MGLRQELASGKMQIEKLSNSAAGQGLSRMAEARLKSLLNNAKEALTNAEQLWKDALVDPDPTKASVGELLDNNEPERFY